MTMADKKPLAATYRVAIIGAGLAGVTAANALTSSSSSKKLDVHEICVLEAQERIGGRVQTQPFSADLPINVEIGAAWIHGTEGNPFIALAKEFGIAWKEISARNPWLHPIACPNFLLFDGQKCLSNEEVQETWIWYELLLKKLQQLATAEVQQDDKSLVVVVEKLLQTDEELCNAMSNCVNAHTRLDFCLRLIEIWMGAKADTLQLDDFVYVDLIGDDPGPHCIVSDGMERYIEHLAAPIKDAIHTNTVVSTINYDGETGVTIECTDGRKIYADYVVVTCALGLLKTDTLRFEPPLPAEKTQAIQQSQMGQYMKVLVQFPHVFWPPDASFLGQINTSLLSTASEARHIYFPLMFNYYAAKHAPILEGVLIGEQARELSSLPDNEIVDAFYKQLQETFGHDIPAPTNQLITRWDKDHWAHGAYSYLTVDSSDEDPEILRQTVGNRILFAGEATNYKYQGALQAAYLSGLKAVTELEYLEEQDRSC